MPKTSCKDLGHILRIINSNNFHKVLVCYNVVLTAHHKKETPEQAVKTIFNDFWVKYCLDKAWIQLPLFVYKGHSHQTTMCAFSFYRK
jgi:hypothetical protein